MEACPGQYRQWPFVGVGVRKMLHSSITGNERRDVQLQLHSDGYKFIKELTFIDGKFKVRL